MIRNLEYSVQYHKARLIGPTFFVNTINAEHYCDVILYPLIAQLSGDEIACACFQQDSAMVHTAYVSMALLCKVFGDRIISSNIWPPRSLDHTPPEFYPWGALINSAYRDNPHSLEDLKQAITDFTDSTLKLN
jgi:hypothetical protein